MPLIMQQGNLFSTPHRLICHGCNTLGVMGAGIALNVKQKYPEAFWSYKKFNRLLGTVDFVLCHDGKIIANAITQDRIGQTLNVDYNAIIDCMQTVHQYANNNQIDTVAMPMIGAGLGGGDWKIIQEIIDNCFVKATAVVYYL